MTFITIGQYFNKLQIVFLILLMAPLFAFIALYFVSGENTQEVSMEYYVIIPSLVLLEWSLAMIMFNKKIKSVRNEQGLGAKLDKYFRLTIVRWSFVASAGLMLAMGYFLTGSDVFTGLYVVSLVMSFFLWPTGPAVAAHLMLRGDEKEMVYFKKDKF